MDQVVLAVGSVLAVGGLALGAVVGPRPRSVREVVYLAIPLCGAILISVLAWAGS